MRSRATARLTSVSALAAAASAVAAGTVLASAAPAAADPTGAFTLTAHNASVARGYAPTFTGNGLLGVRVPAAGQGYAGGTVPADSELAGFYAKPSTGEISERVQQRANLPTWSTLSLAVGGQSFGPHRGRVSGYRQSLNLHTGIISTHAVWGAPGGRVTDVRYQVLTDRARERVGLVRLTFTPRWSGTATVTDAIQGTADTDVAKGIPVLTHQVARSWNLGAHQNELDVEAVGTKVRASLASDLQLSANIAAQETRTDVSTAQSVGQRLRFAVLAGHRYTLTKYVGVTDTDDGSATTQTARQIASSAANAGWRSLVASSTRSWAGLWRGRIEVRGDRALATDVNASQFYLWSSTRSDQDWSISPAGLSSNGYDGHIFWDADTWMFPSLLAQHPALAGAMEAYRDQRLPEARAHAAATGARGARFPWESALTGTEQIPPPVSINSEGLYEQHITSDVALAQWQYYLATGDRTWLQTKGWPVLSGAARFWASRAQAAPGGTYVIHHVTGPDEENPDVSDEAYTQVAAATTLRNAISAAHLTGHHAPASWARIATGLERAVPVTAAVNPEFSGYQGQLVKQADVTLLAYPWNFRSSAAVEQRDLNYYQPRTDPGGPSMDDAANAIESEQLAPHSCQAFVYTERSFEPYLRDDFHQFSETRTGGAFTFMTGIGGFLQEFLYGYSGLRWERGSVRLSPGLSGPLTGVTLRDLHWRGRTFTVAVGRDHTTVRLTAGAPLPITTPSGARRVRRGHPLTIASISSGHGMASPDALRCQSARASSSALGAPPLAAVDGSVATDWQPARIPATLTSPVLDNRDISTVTVRWGQTWPPVLTPNVHPKPTPVRTVRSRLYLVQTSTDGFIWETVARVARSGRQTRDVVHFPATPARYVRLRLLKGSGIDTVKTSSAPATPILPMVQELSAG